MVLVGIVLVDLAYHQALVQLAALVGRSLPARHLQRWLDATAGSLMAIFGLALLSRAVLRR
jgi:threonine/homoserine/homoserine lactone efflux protein